MKGLHDEKFVEYFAQVLELNWHGYDLWAVGGIVSDWDTHDIDCVILGDYDEPRLLQIMNRMKQLGPWSPYWTQDPKPFVGNDEHRRKMRICFPDSNDTDFMMKTWWKWPNTKWMVRKRRGILNGDPVQLIQNGSQVYF